MVYFPTITGGVLPAYNFKDLNEENLLAFKTKY